MANLRILFVSDQSDTFKAALLFATVVHMPFALKILWLLVSLGSQDLAASDGMSELIHVHHQL